MFYLLGIFRNVRRIQFSCILVMLLFPLLCRNYDQNDESMERSAAPGQVDAARHTDIPVIVSSVHRVTSLIQSINIRSIVSIFINLKKWHKLLLRCGMFLTTTVAQCCYTFHFQFWRRTNTWLLNIVQETYWIWVNHNAWCHKVFWQKIVNE